MIRVRGISKSFGGPSILNEVHLNVEEGVTGVIIGPSGAGKSLLLRCLGGLESFDQGDLQVGGQQIRGGPMDIHSNELQALRLQSGFVFQQFNLFPHKTALENVTEGPVQVLKQKEADAETRARQLLNRVGLSALRDRYPHQLSGGEQQRVAIARALAMQPRCLLLDEPTSALDPERVGEVLDVIRELSSEGMTLLIVTHEMQFAREIADTVWVFDSGKVVESGPPDRVFENPAEERTRKFLQRVVR